MFFVFFVFVFLATCSKTHWFYIRFYTFLRMRAPALKLVSFPMESLKEVKHSEPGSSSSNSSSSQSVSQPVSQPVTTATCCKIMISSGKYCQVCLATTKSD